MGKGLAILGAFLGIVGYFIATSPAVIVPPFVPENSPTLLFPPWPIFRSAVALNDFFVKAAAATTPPNVQVLNMITAYWKSNTLFALTSSGILDSIGSGSKSCMQVAAELKLIEHAVCEFMKGGVKLGLLDDGPADIYSISSVGQLLQSETPGSLADFAISMSEATFEAWRGAATLSMKTGDSGFKAALGKEFWEYHNEPKNREMGKRFDLAMKSLAFGSLGGILSSWAPPTPDIVFCDIGGGVGTSAAHFLQHYPSATAIVLDMEQVIPATISFMKEQDLNDRVSTLGGSFLDTLPSELATCDVFFMKYILHDWPDAESIQILKNVKSVAKPGAKIVLAEQVLETGISDSMEVAKSLMSLNMVASCPMGAMERKFGDYASLLAAAGVEKEAKLIVTRDIMSVIEVEV